tara:strand:- start:1843 stop:2649 length:807 start_codon:yes stop_codon:yes gene_type:complete
MTLPRSQRKTRQMADLSRIISVDLDNSRVGIGSTQPKTKLDIGGSINSTEVFTTNVIANSANSATNGFAGSPSFTGLGIITATSFSGFGTGIIGAGFTSIATVYDKKAQGTGGGTFTSGAFRIRDLNTINYSGGFEDASTEKFVTLDAYQTNQFNLVPGKYVIEFNAPAIRVARHRAQLVQLGIGATGVGIVTYVGLNAYTGSGNWYFTNVSSGYAVTSLTDTGYFNLQHRCVTSRDGEGFGNLLNVSPPSDDDRTHENYSMVTIYKF